MSYNDVRYRETFPDALNIQHKIGTSTEKTAFHFHTHMEIIYALSDNLLFRTENSEERVPAGGVLLLNSMWLHYIDYLRGGGLCDRYVLHFHPNLTLRLGTPEVNLLDCFIQQHRAGIVLPPHPEYSPLIAAKLEEMEKRYALLSSIPEKSTASALPHNRLYLNFELAELLLLVNGMYYAHLGIPASPSYQAHSQLVGQICHYIDTHLEEPISLDHLEHLFHYSKTQMYNLFREVLHMSVTDYLVHVRITQAKSLLINTDYPVELIAQKSGYTNPSAFSRVFKAKVGFSPLKYRQNQGGFHFPHEKTGIA